MLLPHGATVAVLDGVGMKLFRNAGRDSDLRLEPVPFPNLAPEAPGSGARHRSSAANPDRSRLAEDGFASAAAGWLNRAVADGQIEGVFVIAAPNTLGELRHHYSDALRRAILAEEAKELSGHKLSDIEATVAAARPE